MALVDKIRKLISQEKKEEEFQKELDSVKEVYAEVKSADEGRKKAIKAAAEKAIAQIRANPNMPAIDLIKMIEAAEELPQEVIVEIATQFPEENTVVQIAEEVDLPPHGLQKILNEADVSLNAARKIAEQISDEEVQSEEQEKIRAEQEIENLNRLEEIYKSCEDKNDLEVVKQIKEIRQHKGFEQSDRIQELINKIIAKRIAMDCFEFGGPRIETMTSVISASDMLKMGFSQKVGKEYDAISMQKKRDNKKGYSYDRSLVREKIIEAVAKEVVNDAENNVTMIKIPQAIQDNASKEEKKVFIKGLQTFFKKGKISEEERNYLEDLGKKEYDELQIAISELNTKIGELPEGTAVETVRTIIEALDNRIRAEHKEKNIDTEQSTPRTTGGEDRE